MVARQAPLFMGFSKQEYWTGLPCPPPGDLPNPGIKPVSSALQADSLLSETSGKPRFRGWVLLKHRSHFFGSKYSSQGYGFSSGRVWMWELDCEESWAPKNWCFWTVVLDCKEIQPVHPKGNWSWVFIGRTDTEAETPILWPPHEKSWLIGKDPDAGRDWGQEGKGMTEDEMVGWHHRLDGHEFG